MDLNKILEGLENKEELIKAINAEIGKEFVPRTDFNAKNEELKKATKELSEKNTALEGFNTSKTEFEKQISELSGKVKGYELNSLKTKIALESGIPYNMVDRLKGEDEKTIKEDAAVMAGFLKSQQPEQPLKETETKINNEESAYKTMLNNLTNKGE